jgi:hypothetical protein
MSKTASIPRILPEPSPETASGGGPAAEKISEFDQ